LFRSLCSGFIVDTVYSGRINDARAVCSVTYRFSVFHIKLFDAENYTPRHFTRIADHEFEFGAAIKRGAAVEQVAAKGKAPVLDAFWLYVAVSKDFSAPMLTDTANCVLPIGAFGESSGPT